LTLYRIETITILTVITIAAILATYITVLRKNGWLGKAELFYRCPNPQCRKIFRKPATVKDLSIAEEHVYQGCPECGADLGQDYAADQNTDTLMGPECKYYFGYLSSHDKQQAIPETCLKCPSSLDCVLGKKAKDTIGVRAKALVQNSILRYV